MSPSPVSSTPLLRTILTWSAIVTAALIVLGGAIGYFTAGVTGMWSALTGVLLAAVFLGITAVSILIANRWYGQDLYVPIFFGIVLGGWIVKFVVFIVMLFVLNGQPWLDRTAFFVALLVSIVVSLVVDVVVLMRKRVPYASDVALPGPEVADEDQPTSRADS